MKKSSKRNQLPSSKKPVGLNTPFVPPTVTLHLTCEDLCRTLAAYAYIDVLTTIRLKNDHANVYIRLYRSGYFCSRVMSMTANDHLEFAEYRWFTTFPLNVQCRRIGRNKVHRIGPHLDIKDREFSGGNLTAPLVNHINSRKPARVDPDVGCPIYGDHIDREVSDEIGRGLLFGGVID